VAAAVNPNPQVATRGQPRGAALRQQQQRAQRRAAILRLLYAKSHLDLMPWRRVSTAWSVAQLAAALGVGVRTVKRDLAELEAAGVVYRERNPDGANPLGNGGRGHGRNRYVLHVLTSDDGETAGRHEGPTEAENWPVSAGRHEGPTERLAPRTLVVLKGTDKRPTPCGERGDQTRQTEPWQTLGMLEQLLGPVDLLEAWGNHELPPRTVRRWRTKQEVAADAAARRRRRREQAQQADDWTAAMLR
jgi:DNA-binding transcriptional ArsR family regulator